jgi:hypothetical protein
MISTAWDSTWDFLLRTERVVALGVQVPLVGDDE